MSERLVPPQSEYSLRSGFRVLYNPEQCLPPDEVSAEMGYEAGQVIATIRFLSKEPHKPINALELGVGTGIILAAMLDGTEEKESVSLFGVDKDPYSVVLSRDNLTRLAAFHKAHPSISIEQADWNDSNLWNKIAQKKYHVMLFNPPYLPKSESARPGYEKVPRSMMYTDDNTGTEHFYHVLPKLGQILSEDIGSSIILRLPNTNRVDWSSEFQNFMSNTLRTIPGNNIAYQQRIKPCSPDRWGNVMTISRSTTGFIPHGDPLIYEARRLNLDHTPIAEELLNR